MLSQEDMLEAERLGKPVRSIYVYEAPVRLWHWINAAAVGVLAVTGYLIGKPLPTVQGEAADNFLFGYLRFAHFTAAYLFAIGLIARVYWACVGNHHARQIFILPLGNKAWWSELLFEVRWYLFLEKQPKQYVGHNPMAQLMMFFFFTVLAFGMVLSGFSLYAEGAGQGSWSEFMFGWVRPCWGLPADPRLAPPGHVDHDELRAAARLCGDPRGHHEPPVAHFHHGVRLAHVQGLRPPRSF